MLVYFDESYNQKYMLYGALFNPHPKPLHKQITAVKNSNSYSDASGNHIEMKYNTTTTPKSLRVAKESVDAFMESTSWFRAIVIDLDGFNYDGFGRFNEPMKIKQARAYKKFAEMLIEGNTRNIRDGVLLCDGMTRCKDDLFMEKMKELFCPKVFREILEIDSSRPETQLSQLNDILLGSVLNELSGSTHAQKSALREYVKTKTKVPSLGVGYWKNISKAKAEELHPKMQVWVFRPGMAKQKSSGDATV